MKILLYTEACFTDSSFPLYRAMTKKGLDVDCLINLSSLHSGMIDIKNAYRQQAIIPASYYSELRKFQHYMDLSRVFVVNYKVDLKHPWRTMTSAIDTYRFILKGKYDIIHTDVLFRGFKKILYFFRKKIVYVRHDPLAHSGMEFSKGLNKDFKIAYKFLRKIVILNNFQYDDFCRIYNIDRKKVFINRLGMLDCIKLFIPNQSHLLENNIIFFGRIVQYKGVEYLCEAMKIVHDTIPSATLIIAGSGKFYFDIEPYKRCPNIEIRNRFIGNEELASLISQAQISIYPYTNATQSGALLTSYALNTPVIATNIDAMRESVVDGKSGVLVPPKNVEELAAAIIDLLSNRKKLLNMRNYIKSEYEKGDRSWSHIVEKYLEIYKN